MSKYIVDLDKLLSSESFPLASAEELRALLVLFSGCDSDTIPKLAKITRARAASAVALWTAEGVISEKRADPCHENGNITEEFEERFRPSEIPERSALSVAESLRDDSLADMIAIIAEMLGEAALPQQNVKRLTAIVTELALTPEYVLTLSAHLKERGALTVTRLTGEAERLVKRGIDNTEALEAYIHDIASATASERELRRLFGIYDRTVTPTMKKYFKRWTDDFGYSTEIIGAAYDISATSTGRLALAHIDKILEGWHESGCITLADCRAAAEKHRAEGAEKYSSKDSGTRSRPKAEAEKPRYGSFDINDAFQKALERSYGKDEN